MTEDEMRIIASRRASYALATIADHQMNTWYKGPSIDTPKNIIAAQILEAMNDALKGNTEPQP